MNTQVAGRPGRYDVMVTINVRLLVLIVVAAIAIAVGAVFVDRTFVRHDSKPSGGTVCSDYTYAGQHFHSCV